MTNEIAKQNSSQLIKQDDYLQMIPIEQAKQWYHAFAEFTQSILKKNLDYGVIPGTPKPSLYKAGAEKLRFAYGLSLEFEPVDKTVDMTKLFVDYTYRCTVKSKTGQILAQCEGNCNSMEAKFGYVWVSISEIPSGTDITHLKSRTTGKNITEFDFAINQGNTTGQYGKPQEYWNKWVDAIRDGRAKKIMKKSKAGKDIDAWELNEEVTLYRLPNPDVIGLKNTIMKMAQKRAFVGAILLATGASEYFTQDIEDMDINGRIYSEDKGFEEAEVVEDVITKKRLTDKGFSDALARIDAGERDLIDKLTETFMLTEEQTNVLIERKRNVKEVLAEVNDDLPF